MPAFSLYKQKNSCYNHLVDDGLRKNEFKFNKSLGQNFISDGNLLRAIVADAKITADDTVVEIGAGAGSLTHELCKAAARVITFEIDDRLLPVLQENLSPYGNCEIILRDILRMRHDELAGIVRGKFKVVANLPYYITTPLLFSFLESDNPPASITIMVQKEVGERLTAKAGTAEYGAPSVMAAFYGSVKITRIVRAEMFVPRPNVDSCVVHLKRGSAFTIEESRRAAKAVRAAFAMRRKTLLNNLSASLGVPKERAADILSGLNIDLKARGETLSPAQFVELAKRIF